MGQMKCLVSTPEPQTPGSHQVGLPTIEFSPIVIHIEYSLHNPVDGVEFVLPSDNNPYVSICYTITIYIVC